MTQPDRNSSAEQRRESQHVDELIDEAGRESFPASDPMAVTPPRHPPADEARRDVARDDRAAATRRPSGDLGAG